MTTETNRSIIIINGHIVHGNVIHDSSKNLVYDMSFCCVTIQPVQSTQPVDLTNIIFICDSSNNKIQISHVPY